MDWQFVIQGRKTFFGRHVKSYQSTVLNNKIRFVDVGALNGKDMMQRFKHGSRRLRMIRSAFVFFESFLEFKSTRLTDDKMESG